MAPSHTRSPRSQVDFTSPTISRPIHGLVLLRKHRRSGCTANAASASKATRSASARMMKWNLTALTYMHVDDWVKLFEEVGYKGDYYWFIAE